VDQQSGPQADPLARLPGEIQGLAASLEQHYRIEREIGRGGMATVYLARDLRHDRRVALKVLNPDLGAVLGVERFLAEIRVTANLQHPNLLPLFDSGGADGRLYYVMPYIEGESLRAKLTRDKQLPIEEALHVAAAVASALDYAHKNGVVHRDLKPENILLQGAQPMIADFGIALAVSNAGGTRVTQTGISLGTPQYMSPEQATSDRTIDGRSDIYSLAAVTYEMLTGEPPHTGSTSQAIIAKLLTDDVRPLTMLRRSVPPHVDDAVRRGLEKLPADRFATAGEFALALGQTAGGVQTSFNATRRRTIARPWTVIAASTFVGAGLTAAALWPRASAAPVERHLNIVLPDSAPVAVTGEAPLGIWQKSIAISRDGRTIAYIARSGGTNRLAARRIDDPHVVIFPGTEGAFAPFFSPDGQWIAYFAAATLSKVSVAGGAPIAIATNIVTPVGGAWPFADRILVASREGQWYDWWPASGGPRLSSDSLSATNNLMPHVLPGGKAALAHDIQGLKLIRFSPMRISAITATGIVPIDSAGDAQIAGHNPVYSPTGHIVFASNGNGTLMALAFDAKSFAVSGAPFPVLDGVRKEATYYAGEYALADDGTMAFLAGGNGDYGLLALADPRTGRTDTLDHPRAMHRNLYLARDGSQIITREYDETRASRLIAHDVEGNRRHDLPAAAQVGTIARVFDDSTAALFTIGGKVRIVSLQTGAQRVLDSSRVVGTGWMDVAPRIDFAVIRVSGLLELRRFVSDSGAARFPEQGNHARVSPDGRWLAYTRDSDYRIMVSPIPPTGAVYQVSTHAAEQPLWSTVGDRLYYRYDRRIWATDVTTTNGFRVGATRLVLEAPTIRVRGRAYGVAPDGRLAVVLGSPEETVPHINVLTGFHERLKRLVPR
jgi:tRNA A-37 threonylcarbamoyl transferase component Bud32